MNSIYQYSFSSVLLVAVLLATVLTGCKDNVIGVEGFCPVVESTNPVNLATGVNLNAIITVTFEEKINPQTMNPQAFTLISAEAAQASFSSQPSVVAPDAEHSEVSGSMTFDNESNTMSFTPDAPLSSNMLYTGRVINTVEDPLGNKMLEDYVWSFTTEEASSSPVPTVVSAVPQNGEVNVALNEVVTATFSHAMNPASINQDTFTLFDGNTQIDGSVSYDNMTATFIPENDLSTETTYTATVTTGAENEMGVSLENNFVWFFSTGEIIVTPPPLGAADSYGIMATAAITNTGNTIINGDVSLDPGSSLTGFPPGIINGDLNINNTESAEARLDLLEAYNYLTGLPPGTTIPAGADLGALYPNGIAPGTYTSGSTMLAETTLVLDAGGDENAVWVFQIGSSLTTSADITLTGGANVNNVFWVTTEDATIGVGTVFHGTIVSGRDVTANTGATINGRILAGAITAGTIALDENIVNVPGFE